MHTRTVTRTTATILAATAVLLSWLLASPALAHPDTKPHPLQASVAVDCGTATVTLVNGHTAPVLWTITTSDGAWTVTVDADSSHDEVVTFDEDAHGGKAFVKWDAIGPEADWRHAASGAVDVLTDCLPPASEPPATEPPASENPSEQVSEPPASEPPATEPPATEDPTDDTSEPAASEDPTGGLPGEDPTDPGTGDDSAGDDDTSANDDTNDSSTGGDGSKDTEVVERTGGRLAFTGGNWAAALAAGLGLSGAGGGLVWWRRRR